MRGGRIDVPPVFIATVVEAIVAHLLEGCVGAFERRAAQLLIGPQHTCRSAAAASSPRTRGGWSG
jgi:hypothetical protein